MDDPRFRTQRSPRDDTPSAMSLVTPPRNGTRLPPQSYSAQQHQQASAADSRSNLHRRFTTDSGRVPTLNSLTSPTRDYPQQRDNMAHHTDFPQRGTEQDFNNNQAYHKVQLLEKKKMEYERIRDQRRRFEVEMQRLERESQREARELAQMEEEVRLGGHQSEPTTPPEHQSGFPSIFSRPSRYSMSSLASPPGFYNRPARSGSQLISPPSGMEQGRYAWDSQLPSRSVPTTRRNSDDDDKDEAIRQELSNQRAAHSQRYSMPATRSRNGGYENANTLDGAHVTRFLFDDDDSATPQANNMDETFPTLVRRDDHMLSASSAALDLALSSSPNPEAHSSSNWSSHINRHRTQQSLSAINGPSSNVSQQDLGSVGHRPASLRHSLDLKYISENAPENQGNGATGQGNPAMTPPKLQSSFSSNDVPTIKNVSGQTVPQNGNANNHAQQHFHNHNASMGRIPAGAMPNRGHTRELSGDSSSNVSRDQSVNFQSLHSALQGNAPPFGPSPVATTPMAGPPVSSAANATPVNAFGGFYPPGAFVPQAGGTPSPGNYGMNMLTAGMQQMNVGAGGVNGNGMPQNMGNGMGNNMPQNMGQNMGNNMYPGQNFSGYNSAPTYNQSNQSNQPRDSQARVIQNRRQMDNEAMSRYQNMPLDSFRGQIYDLCKDQHGCRYLQKKLEERNADQVHTIWLETNQHVIELMTDPFGNYLCQKLLEFCNDDERTVLIQNASQDMVRIALNTHGTRALQKMIEYVGTPQQVHLIIEALRFRVVELIQDLNGNHVIQKCLNKLTAPDSQFIFDAVGNNCVEVGTHRHGCCVLQRCIDHASGDQKLWLIQRITEHSRVLVQDPFGNYVVQYIIDLNEPTFTEPIVTMFQGCISQLSRHKFSSNVIEKCLRCAQAPSKDMIVEEMLIPAEMERLIRDSYANYVVQTALEYATPHQKYRLVEAIRPILPTIRNTPYGRRIQAKVSTFDARGSVSSSGQVTPADNTQGQIPLRSAGHSRGVSGNGNMIQSGQMTNGGGLNNQGQGIEQNMGGYQNGGSVPTSNGPAPNGSAAPGGPVQQPQPQFNQGLQNNYNGTQQASNMPHQSNGGGSWM